MAIIKVNGITTTLKAEELGISSDESISFNGDNLEIKTKNVPEQHYPSKFFGLSKQASAVDLPLTDGSFLQSISMDYPLNIGNVTPAVTLECNAVSEKNPTLTIYWTSTGSTTQVLYATCSASAPAVSNWVPIKRSYSVPVINTVAFTPGKNYTEALIGGNFNSAGSATYLNANYFAVNLSGGPSVTAGGLVYGPVGSVLTNTPTTSTYYGGISGIRINGDVTCILPISVGVNQEYIVYGGNFESVSLYNNATSLPCRNLFIVDKNAPLTRYLRFNLNWTNYLSTSSVNTMTPLCLEYDPDFKTLIVAGSASIKIAKLDLPWGLVDLFYFTHSTSASGLGVTKNLNVPYKIPLFRLSLVKDITATNLWDRFEPLNINGGYPAFFAGYSQDITPLVIIKTAKYFKNILYVGGNFISSWAYGRNLGTFNDNFTALVCTSGSYFKNGSDVRYENLPYVWGYFSVFTAGAGGYAVNNIKIQTTDTNKHIMYVCGNFTSATVKTDNFILGAGTETYTNTSPYLIAFDITNSVRSSLLSPGYNEATAFPKYLSGWNPLFDKPVIDIDWDTDSNALYTLGSFSKVTANVDGYNRSFAANRFCVLSQPDLLEILPPFIYRPYINIAGGAASYFDTVKSIPNTSPLSGVLIATNMTTLNLLPAKSIARIPKKNGSISPLVAKYVKWNIGSKLVEPGGNIAFDSTDFTKITAYPGGNYELQKTIVSLDLNPNVGDIMRFYISRDTDSSSSTELTGRIWFTGMKVGHEQ